MSRAIQKFLDFSLRTESDTHHFEDILEMVFYVLMTVFTCLLSLIDNWNKMPEFRVSEYFGKISCRPKILGLLIDFTDTFKSGFVCFLHLVGHNISPFGFSGVPACWQTGLGGSRRRIDEIILPHIDGFDTNDAGSMLSLFEVAFHLIWVTVCGPGIFSACLSPNGDCHLFFQMVKW